MELTEGFEPTKKPDYETGAIDRAMRCQRKSQEQGSNLRQADYKSATLPTELSWH